MIINIIYNQSHTQAQKKYISLSGSSKENSVLFVTFIVSSLLNFFGNNVY